MGGEGSTVETLLSKTGAKTVESIESVMRKALNPKGASDTSALVWVELNGEPLLAAMRVAENEINLLKPEGVHVMQKKETKMHGTGKWSGRTQKYIPPVYNSYEARGMKPTEAVNHMFQAVNAVIRGLNSELETPHKDHFDVLNDQKITLEVKVLLVDRNRIKVAADRKAEKGGLSAYKGALGGSAKNDTLKQNRKAVLEKYVKQKIDPILDSLKTDIAAQINTAIETGKPLDVTDFNKKISRISSIVRSLASTLRDDDVRFSRNASWGTSSQKTLNYSIDSLVSALKDLDTDPKL